MDRLIKKRADRERRHRRLRQKVAGTAARPRLAVFRSLRHIYAQVVDDDAGKTLFAASTQSPDFPGGQYGGNVKAASEVGKLIALKAKAGGVSAVVFDTGGRKYHGRVKAVAEAAREAGLRF